MNTLSKAGIAGGVLALGAIGAMTAVQSQAPTFPVEPNAALTPGAVDPALTKDVLCSATFRTGTVRSVSESEKAAASREYGFDYQAIRSKVEFDHLVSLEIGGLNDLSNLWGEEYFNCVGGHEEGAHVKDALENRLHKMVCSGTITLADAQTAIRTDWVAAYQKWVSPTLPPCAN